MQDNVWLEYKTRIVINSFNELFVPGVIMRDVVKKILQLHSVTYEDFKKILKSQTGLDIHDDKKFLKSKCERLPDESETN